MCGIAGWADRQGAAPGVETLRAMGGAIAHRGPDGSGEVLSGSRDNAWCVGLAHRRLAIIDLVTGEQPMQERDGAVTLVFNGEVYNFQTLREELQALGHRFRTTSDTEVVLQAYLAWGPSCLQRLRGMFALALWDAEHERLLLARDPFGKKPLYLHENGDRLVFASEIKSILLYPGVRPSLDRDSVLDYLTYRYVPGPNTFFTGIRKLPPGSFALWQAGRLTVHSYYTPPDATQAGEPVSEADAVAAFTAKLDEAVRIRMVSDVPFGAYLSGGLDSSAVVALMSRHSEMPIKTFSVGFAEMRYSELAYAELVAERYRTIHHPLMVTPADVMDCLPRLIHYRDAPVAEPADVPVYLLSVEAAKSVKMVLSGEGSDEFLGGYPKHAVESYVAAYHRMVPDALHRRLIEPLVGLLPYRFSRIKTLVASFGLRDPRQRLPRWFGALSPAERDALCVLPSSGRACDMRPFAEGARTPLRRALYFDQASWLPDNLLERGDRMTMAASIEARMPFMDTELAALMARLPDWCRIHDGTTKWILRQAMAKLVPPEVLNRPKVGFRLPVNEWFRTQMRDFVFDLLVGPDSMTRDFYRLPLLARMLEDHVAGRHNHEKLVWMLVSLELFQRRYRLA